jgi:hypothetical protein
LAEREVTLDHRWKLVSAARKESREQLIAIKQSSLSR